MEKLVSGGYVVKRGQAWHLTDHSQAILLLANAIRNPTDVVRERDVGKVDMHVYEWLQPLLRNGWEHRATDSASQRRHPPYSIGDGSICFTTGEVIAISK